MNNNRLLKQLIEWFMKIYTDELEQNNFNPIVFYQAFALVASYYNVKESYFRYINMIFRLSEKNQYYKDILLQLMEKDQTLINNFLYELDELSTTEITGKPYTKGVIGYADF